MPATMTSAADNGVAEFAVEQGVAGRGTLSAVRLIANCTLGAEVPLAPPVQGS